MDLLPVGFKNTYLTLVSSGYSESKALKQLNIDWMDFFELMARDPDFRKDIDNARKARAEVWVSKIVDAVESTVELTPIQIPAAKLKFEQLKFLAKADNPERYGEAPKGASIAINLNDFKLLSPQESIRALNSDPFNKMVTIEVEPTTIKEEAKDGQT